MPLGRVELMPPDSDGYQFSAIAAASQMSDAMIRREIGLPRTADLPRPYVYEFNGLKDVLNTRVIDHSWTVTVDTSGPPPQHKHVSVSNATAIPKHVLERRLPPAGRAWVQDEPARLLRRG